MFTSGDLSGTLSTYSGTDSPRISTVLPDHLTNLGGGTLLGPYSTVDLDSCQGQVGRDRSGTPYESSPPQRTLDELYVGQVSRVGGRWT